jgi:hypothetical protein
LNFLENLFKNKTVATIGWQRFLIFSNYFKHRRPPFIKILLKEGEVALEVFPGF